MDVGATRMHGGCVLDPAPPGDPVAYLLSVASQSIPTLGPAAVLLGAAVLGLVGATAALRGRRSRARGTEAIG